MVTLKNNGGVELDKDNVVMNVYNCEVSTVEDNSSGSGHAKAVLICRKNSHPFQERTLTLDQPVKIGRSVARARPSTTNGIFDCKVLSRNHAVIWYDNEKFFIHDTKSSNGTFVNNQRLSKGAEDSAPREIFSGDVVQFGVDVLENQRKGNEDSDNSDDSVHIVTHGCIVASVKLFYPNGKEAKSSQSCSVPSAMTAIPQEEICKLQLIIYEAHQREERLHDKLEELQFIISKLEVACQEALTSRFEETRLLSKIENLEKQTKVMSKIRPGSVEKATEKAEMEIHQLLLDVEKVQTTSREIQERQHRKLLENEHKLTEAQRAASNLELEVAALREQRERSETHVQELAAKCTSYSQTIELLKANLNAQMESNQELEARVEECQQREAEFRNNFYKPSKLKKKCKHISEESEDELPKKDKEGDEIVLEWLDRYYTETSSGEQRDRINEDDQSESLSKQLEVLRDVLHNGLQHISSCIGQLDTARLDLDKAKKEVEKHSAKKQELILELVAARLPTDQTEKTENDLDTEKREVEKTIILTSVNNEKITELESELREQEEHNHMLESCLKFYVCMVTLAKDLLNEARTKNKEAEARCNKLKCELDAAIIRCEKLNHESSKLRATLKNHSDCLELSTAILRQRITKLETEKEKSEKNGEEKSLETQGNKDINSNNKESQTVAVTLVSSETSTDSLEEESKIVEELSDKVDKDTKDEDSSFKAEEPAVKDSAALGEKEEAEVAQDIVDNSFVTESGLSNLSIEVIDDSKAGDIVDDNDSLGESSAIENRLSTNNLGVWEKIRRMQTLANRLLSELTLSRNEIREMRDLMNLIAEDLVRLLLREQEINQDKRKLQERLDKSMSQADIAALGLANQFLALMVGVFLYYVGGSALVFFGLSR